MPDDTHQLSEEAEPTPMPTPMPEAARKWGEKFEAMAHRGDMGTTACVPHTTWKGSSIPAMLGALGTAIDTLEIVD